MVGAAGSRPVHCCWSDADRQMIFWSEPNEKFEDHLGWRLTKPGQASVRFWLFVLNNFAAKMNPSAAAAIQSVMIFPQKEHFWQIVKFIWTSLATASVICFYWSVTAMHSSQERMVTWLTAECFRDSAKSGLFSSSPLLCFSLSTKFPDKEWLAL